MQTNQITASSLKMLSGLKVLFLQKGDSGNLKLLGKVMQQQELTYTNIHLKSNSTNFPHSVVLTGLREQCCICEKSCIKLYVCGSRGSCI